MNSRPLQLASLLTLASLPTLLSAQETTAIEDQRMQELMARNQEEWMGPKNQVNIGFRVLGAGGNVNFSKLGTISAKVVAPASDGAVPRVYDNGFVGADGLRSDEVDANGNQTSTPGGRYPIYSTAADGTKTQIGEGLGYQTGVSRIWQEYAQAQFDARPGYVAFTNYSAVSEGGTLSDKMGASAGVELQYSRNFGRISRRLQWGFMGGVTLNSISSKTSGAVTSTLKSHTEYYQLFGTPGTPPMSGPSSTDYLTAGDNGLETTVPVSQTPDSTTTDTTTAGGATVNGRWTVKGAYFMVKLGPILRAQFTDRLGLTASAGLAAAYAGTEYTASESFTVADLPTTATAGSQEVQQGFEAKFLSGYFADLTLEWNANDTTGFFGGVTAQKLSAYDQALPDNGQLAHIDLGSAVGVRGGITIKF